MHEAHWMGRESIHRDGDAGGEAGLEAGIEMMAPILDKKVGDVYGTTTWKNLS